jgi:hypothetical protein
MTVNMMHVQSKMALIYPENAGLEYDLFATVALNRRW